MDVLRKPWLGRVVRETLTKIIQWRNTDMPTGIEDNYQIVGDSVCVRMGRSSPLQIVKFLTFDGEIQARLSDAERMIDVTFSFATVDAKKKARAGRSFTDGTAGGIIYLKDYEIRVRWPANAPQPRLVLYVHEAIPVGSGGEGVFGHPSHIQYDNEINHLLATVSTFDLSNHEPAENDVGTELSVQSQSGDGQFDGEQQKSATAEGTQIDFATQVHQPQLAISNRRCCAPRHTSVGAKRHGSASVITTEDVSARIKERAKANNILDILLPEKRVMLGSGTLEKGRLRATQEATEGPPPASEKETLSATDNFPREPILDPTSEAVSTIYFKGVKQTEARVMGNVGREGSNAGATIGDETGRINEVGTGAASRVTTSSEGGTNAIAKKDHMTDPWAGMTRIPRREVRVPTEQDDLLSNKNCWIPPEPGNRYPVGNIPVPILRSLAAKAERSALKEREATAAAKGPIWAGSQSESGSGNDSDSDVALEWSPSPVHPRYVRVDGTPVDSSPEGARLTYNKSQPRTAHQQPDQGENVQSRRKHEAFYSDNQESSPIAKRQRREKEQSLALKDGEDIGDQSSLRHQNAKSQCPLAGLQDVGGDVGSPPGGNTYRYLTEASSSESEESGGLRGHGKLVTMSTPESAFSPIGNGTLVSQYVPSHQQAELENDQAVLKAGHSGTEMDFDSQNHPGKRERLEPCVDTAAEQISCVLDTQERSSVSGGKIDRPDSDEENELEISLPAALGDEANIVGPNDQRNLTLSPRLPSTAPQLQKSILHVKQTPQLYGEATTVSRHSLASREGVGSPGRRDGIDLSSDSVIPCSFPSAENLVGDPVGTGEQAGNQIVSNFSEDSLLASSRVDTKYRRHSQLHTLENMNDKKESASGAPETESAPGGLVKVATLGVCRVREVNSIAGVMEGEQGRAGGNASHVAVSKREGGPIEGEEVTGEPGRVMHKRRHSKTEETQQSGSRKRPKRFKLPATFAFSEENRQFLNPSEIARNYRQEFFTGLSRQPSPALELSSTPPSAQRGRERNIENISMNHLTARGPEAGPHVTVDLGFRESDVNTHKETASGNPIVEKQVAGSVERASREFDGNWPRRDESPDGPEGDCLGKQNSELRVADRNGTEESRRMKGANPATEKSTRIVLIENQVTGSTLVSNSSGQDLQELPRSDTPCETAGRPEASTAQNQSGGHGDGAFHDSGVEYNSLTTPVERLALLKTLTGDNGSTFEAYTDARVLNTLKNVVTIKQVSREEFSRVLLQIRKSLNLNSWATQVPEPGGSLKPSPTASSSKPARNNPAISTPASSNIPLKTLLSSPAHMKAKGPSSVLDWLEKTSSVDSESAGDLPGPQEQKWWQDRNTPFKEWSRAYISLKSVNGMMGRVDREKGKIVPPCEKMDVLGWNL